MLASSSTFLHTKAHAQRLQTYNKGKWPLLKLENCVQNLIKTIDRSIFTLQGTRLQTYNKGKCQIITVARKLCTEFN